MTEQDQVKLRFSDLAVAVASLGVLAALITPSVAQSARDARRENCLNNIKQIVLGLHNHESARAYFPAASTAPITAEPGNANESDKRAGFSWLAQILPYLESGPLYLAMRDTSNKMTTSPFAASVSRGGQPISAVKIDMFVCPAFAGQPVVDVKGSDYQSQPAGGPPAITNYFALSGTHLVERDGGWFLDELPTKAIQGNGALPMFSAEILKNSWYRAKSTTRAALARDGTSNTIMFCEGREQAYAAWIDGQVAWTVAAWPRNAQLPQMKKSKNPAAPALLAWSPEIVQENGVCISKQPYGAEVELTGPYLPGDRWSGSKDRSYGPSGNHADVAAHAFADGRARFIKNDIDRNVYLHLTTRGGGEVIPDSAQEFMLSE